MLGIRNGGLMDSSFVFKGVDALKQIIVDQTSSHKQCRNCSQLQSKLSRPGSCKDQSGVTFIKAYTVCTICYSQMV